MHVCKTGLLSTIKQFHHNHRMGVLILASKFYIYFFNFTCGYRLRQSNSIIDIFILIMFGIKIKSISQIEPEVLIIYFIFEKRLFSENGTIYQVYD